MIRNPLPGVPLVESPFFDSLVQSLPPEAAALAAQLHRDGFAVIDFPEPDFERIAAELVESLQPHYDFEAWRSKKEGGGAGGLRIQDAVNLHPHVLKIAANARIIELLSLIYGRAAFPFQTLNFPVGTEQHFHTDSLHFSSIPERFMCGLWVALEDVGPDQGPLLYYPGSHKLPVYWNEHYGYLMKPGKRHLQNEYEAAWDQLVAALKLEPKTFCPKRGQALIWAANLLHGGARHSNAAKTRWSQVTHYYFEDCVYLTPMHSEPFCGRVDLRKVADLRTGRVVEHSYLGRPLPQETLKFFTGSAERKSMLDFLRRRDTAAGSEAKLPPDFDPALYLQLHPDVRAAGADPATHYLNHGVWEGRPYK
jgi:hypothetical protein